MLLTDSSNDDDDEDNKSRTGNSKNSLSVIYDNFIMHVDYKNRVKWH